MTSRKATVNKLSPLSQPFLDRHFDADEGRFALCAVSPPT